jgi:hypothetical protein
MIYIERLESKINHTKLTFCDILHKDNTSGKNHLRLSFDARSLTPYVEEKLNGVSIGSKFGYKGIGILQLLASPHDLIIETSFLDLILLTKSHQKLLLKNYTIIINDFEEGGGYHKLLGPCLIEHIKSLDIIPKRIFSVTSGIFQHDYPELNIKSIYFCAWPFITIFSEQFYINLIFDQTLKQTAIDKIKSSNKKFGLCLNRKPKLNRLKLLADLDSKNLLQHFDWTLTYTDISFGDEDDYIHFIKTPENYRYEEGYKSQTIEAIKYFSSRYKMPKLIDETRDLKFRDCVGPDESWIGKYNYYISTETYTDYAETSLGPAGFITEKTIKSFCIGAYPFIAGLPNYEKHLMDLGFKLNSYDYDSLSGMERVTSIVDEIESAIKLPPNTQLEKVIHNFNLITDINFLVHLIVEPIKQMI